MANTEPIRFELEITASDTTPYDLDMLTRSLLKELRETNVESANLVSTGTAPQGTKAGEPVTIGMLAIEVLPAVIPGIVSLVQAWIQRGQGRTVKFKGKGIEFEGSPEELQKLLTTLEKGKKSK